MRRNTSFILVILSLFLVLSLLSGCASGKAKKVSDKIDLSVKVDNVCTDNGGRCLTVNRDCEDYGLFYSPMSCGSTGKHCCVEENQTNQTNYTCTDSDGGMNYYTSGTATSSFNGVKNDMCSDDQHTLSEAYCDGYEAAIVEFDCYDLGDFFICENGECVVNPNMNGTNQTNITCTDTDGGRVYDVRGTTSNQYDSFSDYCVMYSEMTLVEYYCNYGDSIYSESHGCSNGCFEGRCTDENETCDEGWYCYNDYSRAHLDTDCTWDSFENCSNFEVCVGGYCVGNETNQTDPTPPLIVNETFVIQNNGTYNYTLNYTQYLVSVYFTGYDAESFVDEVYVDSYGGHHYCYNSNVCEYSGTLLLPEGYNLLTLWAHSEGGWASDNMTVLVNST